MVKNLSHLARIHYIRQHVPLGLGHAVLCAKSFIANEPFAVLLGDDIVKAEVPALRQIMDIAEETNSSVLGIQEVAQSEVSKYGIVDPMEFIEKVFRVKDLVEKPCVEEAPSRLAILGRYVLTPSIFNYLENQTPGAGGEIQLTDAIRAQSQDEAVYAGVFEGKRYDAGDRLGYLMATVEYALEMPNLGPKFSEYLEDLYINKKLLRAGA